MDRNGVGMITSNYSADFFLNLNLTVDSPDADWDMAINIFKERFEERYYNPIKCLLSDNSFGNLEKNSFAIMALNCLMIDAFYQFESGDLSGINVGEHYKDFLLNHFSHFIKNKDMANLFYKHIRCGILHSAQTQKGSMLSIDCNDVVEFFNGNKNIKVNVKKFSDELQLYFYQYVGKLKNKKEEELRQNFIIKMKDVCV